MFYDNFSQLKGIRLLGISATDWCEDVTQINMFEAPQKRKNMDSVMLNIRNKFGQDAIKKCNTMLDGKIAQAFMHEHMDKS